MFDEGHQFGGVRHREQQKETSTSPSLHNPTRKDPDRVGTGGYPQKEKRGKIKACPIQIGPKERQLGV